MLKYIMNSSVQRLMETISLFYLTVLSAAHGCQFKALLKRAICLDPEPVIYRD